MSTRSCIARSTGEGRFTGVYHHWDGYPPSLGATLFRIYRRHFKQDLDAMLAFLIEQHPAGWSTINNADFTLPAGYQETKYRKKRNGDDDYSKPIPHGPICYCHGGRHEKALLVTEASDCGMEWAYVWSASTPTIRYRLKARTSAANTWSECSATAQPDTSAGRK